MPLIVVLRLVCLFIPGVCKCSHPRGVPFVTWPWRGVVLFVRWPLRGNPRRVLLALGRACYVTHTLRVFFSLTVVFFYGCWFVCLFFTGVCECSHPRGMLFVTWPWMGVLCHTYQECSCP